MTTVCDHCGLPVRVAGGLHAGGFRHDNTESNAAAEWCETKSGVVRVTVNGKKRADDAVGRI